MLITALPMMALKKKKKRKGRKSRCSNLKQARPGPHHASRVDTVLCQWDAMEIKKIDSDDCCLAVQTTVIY
jgi:hypothetical protein